MQYHQPAGLVRSLHDAPSMVSLAVAGAGTQAISWILGVAGASKTVLDIHVPYAPSAVIEYIGSEPEQFVSVEAARSLARSAYERGRRLIGDAGAPVVGAACTATIATDRAKRGDHRCHIAIHSSDRAFTLSLTLSKGSRGREDEDDVVSRLLLNALADAFGLPLRLDPRLVDGEDVVCDEVEFADPLAALVAGHIEHVSIDSDGSQYADSTYTGGIMSGSFDPLHSGHLKLRDVAEDILGFPVVYELSVTNVDKPALDIEEVRRRLSQFTGRASALATHATTFYEKSRLFPRCVFVIGYDTLLRLVAPKYYDSSPARMIAALVEIRDRGCSFLVAGRAVGNGFGTLNEVEVPVGFEDMFMAIPESAFRSDISSSAIRQSQASG